MITKLQVLELIDENDVVEPRQLANYFGMSYIWARIRIMRLNKAGLVEPLGSERGKWILSKEGYRKLDYLRRRENGNRTN